MGTHYVFNPGTASGGRLRNALNQLEQGKLQLTSEQATMNADLDGDGSLDAHFGNVTSRYGFANTSDAHLAWSEINSALSKINTDTAQTSTDTALKQLFTKLR